MLFVPFLPLKKIRWRCMCSPSIKHICFERCSTRGLSLITTSESTLRAAISIFTKCKVKKNTESQIHVLFPDSFPFQEYLVWPNLYEGLFWDMNRNMGYSLTWIWTDTNHIPKKPCKMELLFPHKVNYCLKIQVIVNN